MTCTCTPPRPRRRTFLPHAFGTAVPAHPNIAVATPRRAHALRRPKAPPFGPAARTSHRCPHTRPTTVAPSSRSHARIATSRMRHAAARAGLDLTRHRPFAADRTAALASQVPVRAANAPANPGTTPLLTSPPLYRAYAAPRRRRHVATSPHGGNAHASTCTRASALPDTKPHTDTRRVALVSRSPACTHRSHLYAEPLFRHHP
jgi:hypothetical protein